MKECNADIELREFSKVFQEGDTKNITVSSVTFSKKIIWINRNIKAFANFKSWFILKIKFL